MVNFSVLLCNMLVVLENIYLKNALVKITVSLFKYLISWLQLYCLRIIDLAYLPCVLFLHVWCPQTPQITNNINHTKRLLAYYGLLPFSCVNHRYHWEMEQIGPTRVSLRSYKARLWPLKISRFPSFATTFWTWTWTVWPEKKKYLT